MTYWTEEKKKEQSERIRALKPWEKSTGPKTEEGRKTSSRNAFKHGMDTQIMREVKKLIRQSSSSHPRAGGDLP